MEIQSHITQNPFYLKTHLYSLTLQHILGTYYVLETELFTRKTRVKTLEKNREINTIRKQ